MEDSKTLRGGPWAWCWRCGNGAPRPIRFSVRKQRWECRQCRQPMEAFKCIKCGFEGGDATQLPAPKRPWGFQIKIMPDGHKKVCPKCGDISDYQAAGFKSQPEETSSSPVVPVGGGVGSACLCQSPTDPEFGGNP